MKFKTGDKLTIKLNDEMAKQLNTMIELGIDYKIDNFVFETDNYFNFKKLEGNREISLTNVKQKKELIEKNGFKSTNPIIIDSLGNVIDGQHRLEASKQLNIPIKIIVETVNEDVLKNTIELNNSSKSWNITDYVEAYGKNGNENYIKLLNLQKELERNMNNVLSFYYGQNFGSAYKKVIVEGRFIFSDEKAMGAINKHEEIERLIEVTENPNYKKIVKSDRFMRAYLKVSSLENFDSKHLYKQFELIRYTLLDPNNLINTLADVYNYKKMNNRLDKELLKGYKIR